MVTILQKFLDRFLLQVCHKTETPPLIGFGVHWQFNAVDISKCAKVISDLVLRGLWAQPSNKHFLRRLLALHCFGSLRINKLPIQFMFFQLQHPLHAVCIFEEDEPKAPGPSRDGVCFDGTIQDLSKL
uniref:Uncharacterized protein n=1 Tax=Anguilla anguilla TaxID=7936 RepID=A0A0E9XC50_ANGAN